MPVDHPINVVEKISVVMPLYNKQAEVMASIASIQAQSFTGWELVVINDGSMDGGPDMVELLSVHVLCLTVLRNKTGEHYPKGQTWGGALSPCAMSPDAENKKVNPTPPTLLVQCWCAHVSLVSAVTQVPSSNNCV